MASLKQVHDYACKWIEKFRDPNVNYIELVDHWMADDCRALDFTMDCGEAFSNKYQEAFYNLDALKNVINDITDIPLLGSAVFSRWRYFNHWAYSGNEILEPENIAWFLLVLERLKTLSNESSIIENKLDLSE